MGLNQAQSHFKLDYWPVLL